VTDISSNLLLQSLMRPRAASEQQTMNQLSLATQPPPQSSTTTIRLNPLYGGAPLGPQPLSKDHLVRLAMLEAAYRHLPHPSDSERLRWALWGWWWCYQDLIRSFQLAHNLFIYLFKINDRRTRGPLILPEVHKNTQNTQHKLNKGKKQNTNYNII